MLFRSGAAHGENEASHHRHTIGRPPGNSPAIRARNSANIRARSLTVRQSVGDGLRDDAAPKPIKRIAVGGLRDLVRTGEEATGQDRKGGV